jgi:hypothetical protein
VRSVRSVRSGWCCFSGRVAIGIVSCALKGGAAGREAAS